MKNSHNRRFTVCTTLAVLYCELAVQALGLAQTDANLQFTRLGTQTIRGVNSIHVTRGSIVLATNDDLFLSHDEGVSWNAVSQALPYAQYVKVASSGDTVVAVAKTGKVYRSTNHGFTWHLLPYANAETQTHMPEVDSGPRWTVERKDTSLAFTHFTGVVAELSSASFAYVADVVVKDDLVFLSNRRGGVSTVALPSLLVQPLDMGHLAGEYIGRIAVHRDCLYVAAGTVKRMIYRRQLGERTWVLIQPDRNLSNVEVTQFTATDAGVYVASREHGVLFIPQNTHILKSLNNGLRGSIVESITPLHQDLLVCGRLLGVFTLQLDSAELRPLLGVQRIGVEYIAAANDSCIVVSTNEDWVMRSINGGQSWIRSDSVLPPHSIKAIHAYSSKFYAATSSGVWVSSDSGASWRILDPRLSNVNVSKVVRHDSVTICIGPSGTILLRPNGAIERFDPGVSSNIQPRLADALFHNEVIYAPGVLGLYRSTDFGRTWQLQRLPKVVNVRAAAIIEGRIVVSVDSGELLICPLP